MKLILEQSRSRGKLSSFFRNLKEKKTPNLRQLLPDHFPENVAIILEKMLTMNPQARPSSELLFELISLEDFLKIEIEEKIFELKQQMSTRVEEKVERENCALDQENSDDEFEIEMSANQHNKKVVFDFDFLSTKTKKGPMSLSAKNEILDSILDFPSPFDLSHESFVKEKSLSAGMSPEKQFKLPSFPKENLQGKKTVFFDFEGNTKETPGPSYFDGFDLSKGKIQHKPSYFNFEYDFSNFSSNIWIQS